MQTPKSGGCYKQLPDGSVVPVTANPVGPVNAEPVDTPPTAESLSVPHLDAPIAVDGPLYDFDPDDTDQ